MHIVSPLRLRTVQIPHITHCAVSDRRLYPATHSERPHVELISSSCLKYDGSPGILTPHILHFASIEDPYSITMTLPNPDSRQTAERPPRHGIPSTRCRFAWILSHRTECSPPQTPGGGTRRYTRHARCRPDRPRRTSMAPALRPLRSTRPPGIANVRRPRFNGAACVAHNISLGGIRTAAPRTHARLRADVELGKACRMRVHVARGATLAEHARHFLLTPPSAWHILRTEHQEGRSMRRTRHCQA